jgi:hypothetical protein
MAQRLKERGKLRRNMASQKEILLHERRRFECVDSIEWICQIGTVNPSFRKCGNGTRPSFIALR